jgi:hypothetical protein
MSTLIGSDYYSRVQTLIHNFGMDSNMFYDYLNARRNIVELSRYWVGLRKRNTSNVVTTSNTYLTALTLPADFVRLIRDGTILLFDGDQTWQEAHEIPLNLLIQYKDNNLNFAIDHNAGVFYITGIIDRTYTIYIDYQADLGDITTSTPWLGIPSRWHRMLIYDVVSSYEMGADYDDINARNANANFRLYEQIFNAAATEDDDRQRSSVTTMDYPVISDVPTFVPHKINMNG